MQLKELYLNRYLYRDNDQDSGTKDSTFMSMDNSDNSAPPVPSGGAAQDINQGNVIIEPGNLPDSTINVGDWGWTQSCVFSSTDTDTVSWGSGTFLDAEGNSYAISAGNTGNMSAKTYIYLSLLESETVYQTSTTSSDAVGVGKVIIAVAKNESDAATYNLTEAEQIVGDNILVNTIDASKIVTGTLIVGTNVGIGTAFPTASAGALAYLALVEEAQLGTTVIVGGYIKTNLLTADNVVTGALQSVDYAYSSGNFSTAGMQIDLDNSWIRAKNFAIDGSGNAYFLGNLSASQITTGSLSVARTDADVTGNNTAYDTARVNSLASTTLISGGVIGTDLVVANSINVTNLSAIKADMGTITAGIFKVSDSISVQNSGSTLVGYLGQDPDDSGIWGMGVTRGNVISMKYSSGNYFRIFMDGSSSDAVIDMPSPNQLKIQDNEGNAIGRWYGRNAGFSGLGGLDLFGPVRLYTSSTPPSGASNGMMFYHTTYDEVWVYKAGAWKALAYVP